MKKSLLVLAVASVCAAPAAFADVTLSGAINMGLSVDRGGGKAGTKGYTMTSLAANYSNFNIASVDDIGGGNQVVLNIQTAAGINTTSATLGNRNSYLGVKGGWGGLYWGTNENIYEQYMYESDPLDGAVGMGGNLQMLGTPGGAVFEAGQSNCATGGCVDFYRRTDHTVWYASPSWSGFSFAVDYTLSAYKTSQAGDNPHVLSIGAQFKPDGGPFFVNIAYERHKDMYGINKLGGTASSGDGTTDTGIQVGGGVMFGDVSLMLRYETLQYKADGQAGAQVNKYSRDAIWAAVKLGLPSGYFAAEVGHAMEGSCDRANGATCALADDTDATMIGIGYMHNLSKQSQAQIIFSHISNGDNANYLNAGGGNPNSTLTGVGRTGLYIGLKHVF